MIAERIASQSHRSGWPKRSWSPAASSSHRGPGSACFAGAIGVAAAAPNPKGAEEGGGFQTRGPTAILIDADSGSVLFEKNADKLDPPASMAKLMTAEVVFNEIKQGKLKLDDEFIVSENAWRKGGAPSRGSTHVRGDPQPGARSTICCTA